MSAPPGPQRGTTGREDRRQLAFKNRRELKHWATMTKKQRLNQLREAMRLGGSFRNPARRPS